MAVGVKKTVQIRMVWFSVLAVIGFLGTSEKFRTLNRDGLCDQYLGYLTKPPDTLLKIAGLFLTRWRSLAHGLLLSLYYRIIWKGDQTWGFV